MLQSMKLLQFSYLGISVRGCSLLLAVSSSRDSDMIKHFLHFFLNFSEKINHCCLSGCLPAFTLPFFTVTGPAPASCPPHLTPSQICPRLVVPLETASAQKPQSPLAAPTGSPSSKAILGILGQKASCQQPAATMLCPGHWPRQAPGD